MMSVALMGCASKSPNWDDIGQLASTGFGDLTRLASGDPVMHRDICVTNREPIVAWMDAYIRELYDLRNMLANEDGPDPEAVEQVFVDAKLDRVSGPEIPTFGETMSEMFIGRRGMEVQKKLFAGLKDDPANKKK